MDMETELTEIKYYVPESDLYPPCIDLQSMFQLYYTNYVTKQ